MIVHQTLAHLQALKLAGMAAAFEEQLALPPAQTLPFEDRFALLVERESAHRSAKRLTTLLRKARLKYATANLEDIDTRASRGLDRRLLTSLAHGEWLERSQDVLITGATGVGKTWLACALAQRACRLGRTTLYARVPRLLEELRVARGDGTHKYRLAALAKLELLVLDDWGLHAMDPLAREELLEVIDDRSDRRSTVIVAQLPIEHWHAWIAEPSVADAILDRLVHHAHRITLKGESLRRRTPDPRTTAESPS
jgi:DNA replication protein DnaC